MAAIFNDLLVTGNIRTTGSFTVRESGEIKEGNKEAISGDMVNKFINYPYKKVLYLENGYDKATVPIIVDDIVKKTRAISIQVLKLIGNRRQRNIPAHFQLYDPEGWINSLTPKTQTTVVTFYISGFTRAGFAGSTELYGGHNTSPYYSFLTINTLNNDFNNPAVTLSCQPKSFPSGLLFKYTLWKTPKEDGPGYSYYFSFDTVYKNYESIVSSGDLKYYAGNSGNDYKR